MSGGLPPRTAVVTFCSVLSLLTYRLLTFSPGFCFSYWLTSLVKVLASVPVQPSQIWIEAVLLLPPPPPPPPPQIWAGGVLSSPPPPPPPPLWLSVPQADSTSAAAPSRLAIVTYSRCLAIRSHLLSCLDSPARSVQVLSNSDHARRTCQEGSNRFRSA